MQFQYYNDRALFYVTDEKTKDMIRIDFDTVNKTIEVQKNSEMIGTVRLS